MSGERDPRPVLLVTNHAPDYRVPAFAALHALEGLEIALVGGDVRHGGGATGAAADALPVRHVPESAVLRLAASGRYRAVIAGLSGRVALPAAYAGARLARVPFVLWATIWAHPRTPAHAASYLPLRHLYRHADAVVTYGRHVTRYVRDKGASGLVLEAPQAVDDAFWSGAVATPDRRAPFQLVFAGRLAEEKGIDVLLEAWRRTGLAAADRGRLVLAGEGPEAERARNVSGVEVLGRLTREALRQTYAGSDALVLPSIPTRDFLEPWGLVVNEAMDRSLPVITTTAVGAAAGGLVVDEATGLVVPAGDADALAHAIRRLHDSPRLRGELGAAGREGVRRHTFDAWAGAVSCALEHVRASQGSQR